jgi:RHS repeat-associated protein
MVSSWTEGTGGGWSQDWQAVWGPSQDELVEFHNFHTGQTYVVVQDHRNSIAALFDDTTGTLHRVMHYTPEGLSTHYDRYGLRCDEETSLTVTCTETNIPFGFNGMWRSSATGLSYMRNRWYSPQLAQFMSHDPMEYIDSYNMYAFAALDPINFWDPWGLEGAGLSFFEKAAQTIGSAAESVGNFLSDLFSSSGGSEVADGVGDYFMWGSWGDLADPETYRLGLEGWGNESKRRINNAGEVLDIRNFSPLVNDIEGLLDSANRLIHAIESGDNRELGKIGTEAALSVIASTLLKKSPRVKKGPKSKQEYPRDSSNSKTVYREGFYKSERDARSFARTQIGRNPVEIEPGKWRSRDGKWQYRAKENDLEGHGPNDSPHIHLERLDPSTGVVLVNWHLRW